MFKKDTERQRNEVRQYVQQVYDNNKNSLYLLNKNTEQKVTKGIFSEPKTQKINTKDKFKRAIQNSEKSFPKDNAKMKIKNLFTNPSELNIADLSNELMSLKEGEKLSRKYKTGKNLNLKYSIARKGNSFYAVGKAFQYGSKSLAYNTRHICTLDEIQKLQEGEEEKEFSDGPKMIWKSSILKNGEEKKKISNLEPYAGISLSDYFLYSRAKKMPEGDFIKEYDELKSNLEGKEASYVYNLIKEEVRKWHMSNGPHCDLKPDNICLSISEGQLVVKLIDPPNQSDLAKSSKLKGAPFLPPFSKDKKLGVINCSPRITEYTHAWVIPNEMHDTYELQEIMRPSKKTKTTEFEGRVMDDLFALSKVKERCECHFQKTKNINGEFSDKWTEMVSIAEEFNKNIENKKQVTNTSQTLFDKKNSYKSEKKSSIRRFFSQCFGQ